MRLLLYNIRYGTGTGVRFHFPFPFSGYLKRTNKNLFRIIDFIKSVDPDIIGLIEVDRGSFRSYGSGQAEIIANNIGHFSIYGSKYAKKSLLRIYPIINKQGNAFLSRIPIVSTKKHYFSDGIKRLIIEIELEDVVIFLVHLSLKFRHRHHQLAELNSLLKKTKKPVIVAGDLNTMWGDRELHLFLEATGLKNVNIKSEPSYPSHAPKKQLDFILCSPKIKIIDFMIPDVILSDHSPLGCDFEVEAKV